MKIGIVQYSPVWEDREQNFLKIKELIERNVKDEQIIILPEMSLTGFTMNSSKFAEDIDGFATTGFIKLAANLRKHIIAGIIEREEDNIYNSLYHIDGSGIIFARYRKVHPFSYSKEDKFYTAGSEPVITQINKTDIGLSICYDLRFPELYRHYGKKRTKAMINIANWPVDRIEHWKHLLKARAIENQAYMIGVNRTGTDPFYEYNGSSAVYDPMGKEIFSAGNEEGFYSVEIDTEYSASIQERFPFLKDIRLL